MSNVIAIVHHNTYCYQVTSIYDYYFFSFVRRQTDRHTVRHMDANYVLHSWHARNDTNLTVLITISLYNYCTSLHSNTSSNWNAFSKPVSKTTANNSCTMIRQRC